MTLKILVIGETLPFLGIDYSVTTDNAGLLGLIDERSMDLVIINDLDEIRTKKVLEHLPTSMPILVLLSLEEVPEVFSSMEVFVAVNDGQELLPGFISEALTPPPNQPVSHNWG